MSGLIEKVDDSTQALVNNNMCSLNCPCPSKFQAAWSAPNFNEVYLNSLGRTGVYGTTFADARGMIRFSWTNSNSVVFNTFKDCLKSLQQKNGAQSNLVAQMSQLSV